ncbi:DUF3310 domain-containing protein [Paenibacillus melissococcoides]|uniref:DUF3310 domain-containing protein n=1 Tax=Paenibacillus melissococcoides TaxID=2912268 RepID=A0ABN8U8L1_9BACL|nr:MULTISPECIES: DUF3310 domain-containing protein [Paenibacillus]MEB9896366.1 DUF3310 domain-containing protein [Bacillus cereus]CAH8247477.1 DUF3310 domain-containing protein [Paenibacillus melissococcoides]CAH8705103.1 DUF3310 domain-containing protein [Paenibacillus melissococcoides]CAH8714515.1 DUF3310 domain-containing protein [Paenibacillus melissococcoides]GIO82328.1 hypothetical protein J6TS7_59380 [Paenibacillus dendritiformis]
MDKRTSIPKRDVEAKSSGSGPVVEYQLSPEELERYRAMPTPDGKVKMPVGLRIAGNDEGRRESKKGRNEKQGPDCGLTKRDLLEAVAAGESLSSIERAWKVKNQTLQYWVKKWDLRGITPEKARQLLEKAEDRTPTPSAEPQADPLDTLIEADSDLQSWKQLCDSQAQCILEQSNRIMDYESELARWAQIDSDNRQRIAELEEEHDPVERPSHYTVGGIETIDIIRAKLTPEEFRGYCKGNVLKYVCRERWKGGDEDLQKTRKYIEFMLGDEKA